MCSPQPPGSRFPDILPKFQVDRGAIRFVLSGANIMAPGLTSAGGKMDDVPEGTTVGIFAEGTRRPVQRRAEAGGPRWPLRSGGGQAASVRPQQHPCGLRLRGCGWPRLAEALCSLWHELAPRAAPRGAGWAEVRASVPPTQARSTRWPSGSPWRARRRSEQRTKATPSRTRSGSTTACGSCAPAPCRSRSTGH